MANKEKSVHNEKTENAEKKTEKIPTDASKAEKENSEICSNMV